MSAILDRVEVSQRTSSGVVKARKGEFYGIVVIASASGLITIYDNASAGSGTKLYEKTMAAGDVVTFGGLGIAASNGLYMTLVSGTITANILYR